jgi:hypothetical protein
MALIEANRATPFQWGVHDCMRFACRVIEALTGVNRWPEIAGYRTRREASELLVRYGATDFVDAGDRFFNVPHTVWKRAHRGDIACGDPRGSGRSAWYPLGVVLGYEIAFLSTETGFRFAPLAHATCVWPIE